MSLGNHVEEGSLLDRVRAIRETIACRAYELFEERGHQRGHALEDWLRAEAETLLPISVETYGSEGELNALMKALTPGDVERSMDPASTC